MFVSGRSRPVSFAGAAISTACLVRCHVAPTYTDKTLGLYRARQLYKNISMLFLFPVKTVSLVQASIHNVSYISLHS